MANNTKTMIFQAYVYLMTTKQIEKITVKDVANQCGITRQTFYYHFQDLLDVIEWGFCQGTENTLQKCLEAETIKEALHTLLEQSASRRPFGKRLLNSQKRTQICSMVLEAIQKWLFVMFKDRNENTDYSVDELDFALHFYAYAIAGCVYDVILNENADLESIASQIAMLIEPLAAKYSSIPIM